MRLTFKQADRVLAENVRKPFPLSRCAAHLSNVQLFHEGALERRRKRLAFSQESFDLWDHCILRSRQVGLSTMYPALQLIEPESFLKVIQATASLQSCAITCSAEHRFSSRSNSCEQVLSDAFSIAGASGLKCVQTPEVS